MILFLEDGLVCIESILSLPLMRVFSGIQPTGKVHLGNYVGAIHNWIQIQSNKHPKLKLSHPKDSITMVADLHSLTIHPNHTNTLETTAALLSFGLDADSLLFRQSKVPDHTRLAWILACRTPIEWLRKMIQWKEKGKLTRESGLLMYPVLQSADILLYRAQFVPVGYDQCQHIELAREIARRFNNSVGADVLLKPEPILNSCSKIYSLSNADSKMSKSGDEMSALNISDTKEEISLKIKKAKTDSIKGIQYDPSNRKEISNLVQIFAIATGQSCESIADEYSGKEITEFKNDLTESFISFWNPFQLEYMKLIREKEFLLQVLEKNEEKARLVASETMKIVDSLLGL